MIIRHGEFKVYLWSLKENTLENLDDILSTLMIVLYLCCMNVKVLQYMK